MGCRNELLTIGKPGGRLPRQFLLCEFCWWQDAGCLATADGLEVHPFDIGVHEILAVRRNAAAQYAVLDRIRGKLPQSDFRSNRNGLRVSSRVPEGCPGYEDNQSTGSGQE